MCSDDVEREVDDQLRAVDEHPRSPERRTDGKPPLGRAEARLELAYLEDADGGVHAMRHDREADVVAGRALAMGPRDEPLEPFDRGRRRRNEPRHFLGREHRQQRRRVGQPQLAQRHQRSGQDRQRLPPVLSTSSPPGRRQSPPARPTPTVRHGRASFPWLEPSQQTGHGRSHGLNRRIEDRRDIGREERLEIGVAHAQVVEEDRDLPSHPTCPRRCSRHRAATCPRRCSRPAATCPTRCSRHRAASCPRRCSRSCRCRTTCPTRCSPRRAACPRRCFHRRSSCPRRCSRRRSSCPTRCSRHRATTSPRRCSRRRGGACPTRCSRRPNRARRPRRCCFSRRWRPAAERPSGSCGWPR